MSPNGGRRALLTEYTDKIRDTFGVDRDKFETSLEEMANNLGFISKKVIDNDYDRFEVIAETSEEAIKRMDEFAEKFLELIIEHTQSLVKIKNYGNLCYIPHPLDSKFPGNE